MGRHHLALQLSLHAFDRVVAPLADGTAAARRRAIADHAVFDIPQSAARAM